MLLKFSLEILSRFTVEAFHWPPNTFEMFRSCLSLLLRFILQATVSGGGHNEKNGRKQGNAQPLWEIVLTVLVLVEHDPEYLLFLGIVGSHLDWKKTNKEDKYCTKLHPKCTVKLTLVGKERTRRLGQTWQEG